VDLSIIITVFIIIGILNIFIHSYYFFISRKDSIYKNVLIHWSIVLLHFILQGVFNEQPKIVAFVFGFYYFANYYIIKSFNKVIKGKINNLLSHGSFLLGNIIGVILMINNASFFVYTLPLAFGVTLTIFIYIYTNYKKIFTHKSNLIKIGFIALILNGIHFLDFPFLRYVDSFTPIGFMIALIFMCIFSFLILAITDLNYLEGIKKRISAVNEERDKAYKLLTINQLLSNLSHEINNPLQSISLAHELLSTEIEDKDKIDTEQIKEYVEDIANAVKRINHVSDCCHKISQKAEVEFLDVNLSELFGEIANLNSYSHDIKKISVEYHDGIVKTNSHLLTQGINNLIKTIFEFHMEEIKIFGTKQFLSLTIDAELDPKMKESLSFILAENIFNRLKHRFVIEEAINKTYLKIEFS